MGRPKREHTPDIGARIRWAREGVQLSQKALGKVCDVGENTVWKWEDGRLTPTIEHFRLIKKKCRVSLDWLIG